MVPLRLALLAQLVLALSSCAPQLDRRERAIVSGTPDTGHSAVGFLLLNAVDGIATGACSAVIVGPTTLLTAAHCLRATTVEHTIFKSATGKLYHTAALHPHPAWDKSVSPYLNDVGLALLEAPVDLGAMKLSASAPSVGLAVTLVGYGRSAVDDPKSAGTRRFGNLTIASVESTYFKVSGGQGNTAEGDSGGAALASPGGEEVQIGVVSSSSDDFTTSYHVRVDAFLGWLQGIPGNDIGGAPVLSDGAPPSELGAPPGDGASDAGGFVFIDARAELGEAGGRGGARPDGCSVSGGAEGASSTLLLLAALGAGRLRRRRR